MPLGLRVTGEHVTLARVGNTLDLLRKLGHARYLGELEALRYRPPNGL